MDIHRLALLVLLLTVIGFITVFQQVRTWRQGYRINELREKRRELSEEQRRLELEVARARSGPALVVRAQELSVPVAPQSYNVVRVEGRPRSVPAGTPVERKANARHE